MSIKLIQHAAIGSEKTLSSGKHILFVLEGKAERNFPFAKILERKLQRTRSEYKDLNKTPIVIELPDGGVASFVMLGENLSIFQKHTLLRKAVKPLLDEQPEALAICVFGDGAVREANACAAYYVATVNAAELPSRKKDNKAKPLKEISIHGFKAEHDYSLSLIHI